MPNPEPAIKVLLLPKDTNALGTIFGGPLIGTSIGTGIGQSTTDDATSEG